MHELPSSPNHAATLGHTNLLYEACNKIVQQRLENDRVRRFTSQHFMFGELSDELAKPFDPYIVELPHKSPTAELTHEVTLEVLTKGWCKSGRFKKHITEETSSGYPSITIKIERNRKLESPRGRKYGSFVLSSSISYTCLEKAKPLERQDPEPTPQSGFYLERGIRYARDNDSVLWENMFSLGQNYAFNLQAINQGRYGEIYTYYQPPEHLERDVATVGEFIALYDTLHTIPTSRLE